MTLEKLQKLVLAGALPSNWEQYLGQISLEYLSSVPSSALVWSRQKSDGWQSRVIDEDKNTSQYRNIWDMIVWWQSKQWKLLSRWLWSQYTFMHLSSAIPIEEEDILSFYFPWFKFEDIFCCEKESLVFLRHWCVHLSIIKSVNGKKHWIFSKKCTSECFEECWEDWILIPCPGPGGLVSRCNIVIVTGWC